MCIIYFISNRKQFLLRHSAMLRTDRFEHSLEIYKNEFKNEFLKCKNDKACSKCNKENFKTEASNIISEILKTIDVKKVEDFFDKLKEIYIHWINTQILEAIDKMKNLIQEYNLGIFKENLKHRILFRGRLSNTFISHWDMFHIPFNRRFLITNQRYSLVGQPILYFATSPYTVFKELQEYRDLRIARFKIKNNNTFTIFENINKFEYYIDDLYNNRADKERKKEKIESIQLDNMIHTEELNDEGYVKSMFYLMILASCCSFSRRQDTIDKEFSEEYVLPQILTIALKQMGYDGIKYISTRMHTDENIEIMSNKVKNILYSNYCVFTNYTMEDSSEKTNVYDKKLYTKFDISNVISYNSNIESELFKVKTLNELIGKLDKIDMKNSYEKDIIYVIAEDIKIINELLSSFQQESVNNKILILKNLINMHILFIRDILLEMESNQEV